jgi:hypothetical protein
MDEREAQKIVLGNENYRLGRRGETLMLCVRLLKLNFDCRQVE